MNFFNSLKPDVASQFLSSGINKTPKLKIDSMLAVEDIYNLLTESEKENFKKILSFSTKGNQAPSEYALGWALDGLMCGDQQLRSDIILQNKSKVSVKQTGAALDSSISAFKIGSSENYKMLMCLWSFYCYFINDNLDINPTNISKEHVLAARLKDEQILAFEEFLCKANKSNLKMFSEENRTYIDKLLEKLEVFSCDDLSSYFSELINEIARDAISENVDHFIIYYSTDNKFRVIQNVNTDRFYNNFFHKHFKRIKGNEMYIKP